jgi:6-pyruvoyltetrahydropterin/6-carboxytetrahydropterin synthase
MEMLLSVDFMFSAAHQLEFVESNCKRMHGHNYKLRLVLAGTPSPKTGMIRDFDEIKKRVWETVLVEVDHMNLNAVLDNPTAENILEWMWPRLEKVIPGLCELSLWETPEFCATLRKAR